MTVTQHPFSLPGVVVVDWFESEHHLDYFDYFSDEFQKLCL